MIAKRVSMSRQISGINKDNRHRY